MDNISIYTYFFAFLWTEVEMVDHSDSRGIREATTESGEKSEKA